MNSQTNIDESTLPATRTAPPAQVGALVLGGDHPGLAVARSLGRRGIPVYIVDDQRNISSFSRYAQQVITVEDLRDERRTLDSVLEVGRKYDLRDWVLFPTRDENVAAISRHREELSAFFRVTTPAWETVRWAWDKKNTYELAEELNIPCPKTFNPRSLEELAELRGRLPLAMKPAVKENFFYATGAKAWRADTFEQLQDVFTKAGRQIAPEEILLQEIIPGDAGQYSYCAFVRDGKPHSVLIAERVRQHPHEFGRAATYVETIDLPAIEALSERFLKFINFNGLVEIEYKRDPRDNQYKLLDVNARTWGFHGLGDAAGVDFPYLLFAEHTGLPMEPCRSRPGVGWLRALADVPTAFSDIAHGYTSVGSYLGTLRRTRVESVFSTDDPLPFFAEIALLPYLVRKKYFPSAARRGNGSAG